MKPVRKVNGPSMMANEWAMPQSHPMMSSCSQNQVVPVVGFPRSAFEAVHDESSKFRQLPCRTLISVGVCPYREKCVFLHDPRCVAINAKSITRLKNKNKDDCIADSLYWPAMPRSMVMQYPENEHNHHQEDAQPHTVQPYCVPVPQQDQYRLHDAAVYSMWMHFVDFCLATASPSATADSAMCYAAVDVATNPYARSKRLPVFRTLCRGQHVPPLPNAREDLQYRRGEYGQGLPASYQQPPQVPLTYSNQTNNHGLFPSALSTAATPVPAVSAAYSAPVARVAAPIPSGLLGASAGSRTDSSHLNEPLLTVSSVLRSPASPAPLVRRQSTSSPVSITEASALEYDTLNGGFDDGEDLVDVLDLNDDNNCGLNLNLGSTGDFSSSLSKQSLTPISLAPMLLQSIF